MVVVVEEEAGVREKAWVAVAAAEVGARWCCRARLRGRVGLLCTCASLLTAARLLRSWEGAPLMMHTGTFVVGEASAVGVVRVVVMEGMEGVD